MRGPEGLAARFLHNVSWNLLGQVGIVAINFLLTPYLVGRMGVETYGLYILLHTAAGYLSLFSLGAGPTTVKYAAEFSSTHDGWRMRLTLAYSIFLHALGATTGAVLLWTAAPFLTVTLFHIPAPLCVTAIFVLRCAAAGAIFAAMVQCAYAILQGLQRFDLNNILALTLNAFLPLGAAAVFAAGWELKAAALWYVALSAAMSIATLGVAARLVLRTPQGQKKDFNLSTFTRYGLATSLGPLAWIVTFQFDKLFIAKTLPLAELTLYSIPAGVLQRLQMIPAMINAALFPIISELRSEEIEQALPRIYLKSVRALLWVLLPALVLLFALMPQFLTLWLGGDFGGRSVWSARLLVLSQVFWLLIAIPHQVAAGRGSPAYQSGVSWAQAILSMVLWWWLIPYHGILGAAAGSLIAQAVPACFYLYAVHRRFLGLTLSRYLEEGLCRPFAVAALLLMAVFPLHAQASNWPRLLLLVTGGCVLYGAVAWVLLASEDRDSLRQFLRWESVKQC
jgi:O-antigen/teichoic acid export membrane protein